MAMTMEGRMKLQTKVPMTVRSEGALKTMVDPTAVGRGPIGRATKRPGMTGTGRVPQLYADPVQNGGGDVEGTGVAEFKRRSDASMPKVTGIATWGGSWAKSQASDMMICDERVQLQVSLSGQGGIRWPFRMPSGRLYTCI